MIRISRAVVAMVLLAHLSPQAHAASLRISPIGIDLAANERASSLTLANTADEPVSLQIRIFKWSQVDGEDKLEPTSEILVSPPAATVPAGASYTIRVARPSVSPVQAEQSYRLFIDELPKPVDPRAVGQGVSMVLRTSMPVFITDKKAIAQLQWRVAQKDDGIQVSVTNMGQRHAKVANLILTGADGTVVSSGDGLNGYVLAGSTRAFTIKAEAGQAKLPALPMGSTWTLTAKNRTLDIKETVVVGNP